MAWDVGDLILDTYRVLRVHSRGGMGLVYRVLHLGWEVDLAMKGTRPELFGSPAERQAFVAEAETWVGLGLHPNVCACHYVRLIGGVPHIFAEYVEGGSLREWIDDGRLYAGGPERALARILDVAIQVAWGLGHAHAHGVVHLDVKPGNVLLGPDDTAKVTDFGLARSFAGRPVRPGAPDPQVTVAGMTLAYASPEQAVGGRAGKASDVWSFAVTVLECFTGEVNWTSGPAAGAALAAYTSLPSGGRPALPPALADLLARCLRPARTDRPQNLAAVSGELAEIHRAEVGRPYGRAAPRTAGLRADERNNRGLSLLDLGRPDEAVAELEAALATDPRHVEATVNQGLLSWRRGELTDLEVVASLTSRLANSAEPERVAQLLARVHGERGDAAASPTRPGLRLATGTGHEGWIRSVALSADGRIGLSGGQDDTARLWEVATGRCLAILTGHTSEVGAVRLSADGRLAVTGSRDGTARVWDTASGECLHVLAEHTSSVDAIGLTADGRTALTGGGDTKLRVWDTTTGACVRVFTDHTTPIDALCLSADGTRALVGELQSYILVWDLVAGYPTARLAAEHHRASSLSLSADGRYGTVSAGGVVWVWDLAAGELLHLLGDGPDDLNRAELSADGRWVLTGGEDKTVRLWETATGRCLRTFDGHRGVVTGVALSADGRLGISAGGWDETVGLWQLPEPVEAPLLLCRPRSTTDLSTEAARVRRLLKQAAEAVAGGRPADALAPLAEARTVSGHERDAAVRKAWRDLSRQATRTGLADFWTLRTITADPPMTQAADLAADGSLAAAFPVAFGGGDRRLRVWDLEQGHAVRALAGHTDVIGAVSVGADGRWALSGGRDRTVRLWNLATGAIVHTLTGHAGAVDSVCLIDHGRALSAGVDGEIRVWDLAAGSCARTLAGHDGAITGLAVDRAGRIAVSGGQDGSVRLWDLADGTAGRVLTGHDGPVRSVRLSADGSIAVSGGVDHTVRVWDVDSGQVRHVLTGHTDRVNAVRLTADGLFAVSGSHDHAVRVWDLGAGECVAILAGHTAAVESLSLSADGFLLLSGGWDKTLRLWELDWRLAVDPAIDRDTVAGQDPPFDQ